MPGFCRGARVALALAFSLATTALATTDPASTDRARTDPASTDTSKDKRWDFSGPSPWETIRQVRISQLLPEAMRRANVDSWLIICRENANDPLASHVGCENAGGTAVVLFARATEGVQSSIFSPVGEATALQEKGLFDRVVSIPRGDSAIPAAATYLRGQRAGRIAINSFSDNPQADGLSHSQYLALTQALGEASSRLVPSEQLVYEWLSRKLPQEVAIMAQAAELTSKWQHEAYARVVPGKTTDADIGAFLKEKILQAGVQDGWAPEQNPAVNSGPDRGHSHPTDRVIQPGDVIQIDFGIRVFGQWVTDIQRFAYVLQPGESQPPAPVQHAWESAVRGSRAAFAAMAPGVRGIDVDAAQRAVMDAHGSLPVMWSTGHPVGYVPHDTGPSLGGAASDKPRPAALLTLEEGMTFAFDGFYSWHYPGSEKTRTKTISVEEMAVVTGSGAKFLIPPQNELILIRGE